MNFRHNSWDLRFREPFGAMPTGSEVVIRAYTSHISNVKLRTYYNKIESYYDMVPSKFSDTLEYTLTLPEETGILWYDFSFDYDNTHYCYGTQNDTLGGEGQIYEAYPPSYQITLYNKTRDIPEWYTDGIMYQIFPDRFNKGEKQTFTPEYSTHSLIHGNWNDSPHYFRNQNGDIDYWDFFGGNLQGIIEKLDYLKTLNISILYLNPIFESKSNHKYDTANYLRISPDFGTESIFEELCAEAQKRGIRVILDGVFSHTGDDSLYFNRYGNYSEVGAYQSQDSPYYSWYRFSNYPEEYESWWGVKSMPNVEELNPQYKKFIFEDENSVIRKWLKAGASGWRLDVADELPDEFIAGIKKALLKEKDDAILIGEVWEDASRKVAYDILRQYFSGHELDAVMNYPFREAFIAFMLGHKNSRETSRLMMSLYENYPRGQFKGNMNLIDSHDRARILTTLGEAPSFTKESYKESYKLNSKQYNLAKKRLMLLSFIQMTFPGVPCIYYGDEAGSQGFEDPYNRGTYPWGNEDPDLMDWYKKITTLRAKNKSFQRGSWYPLPSTDDIFAFVRDYQDQSTLCIFNRNTSIEQSFTYNAVSDREGLNLLTDEQEKLDQITLAPLSGKVLKIIGKKIVLNHFWSKDTGSFV